MELRVPAKRIFEPAIFLCDDLRGTDGNEKDEESGMSYGIEAVKVSSSDHDIDVLSNP